MYGRAKQFTLRVPLLRKFVGVVLLCVGLVALITPMTPGGIILTIIGLELIGLELVMAKKLKARLTRTPRMESIPTREF